MTNINRSCSAPEIYFALNKNKPTSNFVSNFLHVPEPTEPIVAKPHVITLPPRGPVAP